MTTDQYQQLSELLSLAWAALDRQEPKISEAKFQLGLAMNFLTETRTKKPKKM